MTPHARRLLLAGLCLAGTVRSGAASDRPASPESAIRHLSEELFLIKTTQAEQAALRARAPSDFSLELRPDVGNDDAGIALRIYLPGRHGADALRRQLELAARSEELRVAEWHSQELLAVYRNLSTYRLLRKQIALVAAEMELLEPWLARADQAVQKRQFAAADRARLTSHFLDLLNNRQNLETAWIQNQLDLHLSLGSQADLESFAEIPPPALPLQPHLDALLQLAMENRADYQQLDAGARALEAAEAMARAQDGFQFKYIQPSYSREYRDGVDNWAVSAAVVLPWGPRNPRIAEYREQRELADFQMALQRRIIKERLQSLIQASHALQEQIDRQTRQIQPLLVQLTRDADHMQDGHLGSLREWMQLRGRILDTALQNALVESKREQLALDFAEALGHLPPPPATPALFP
jgi:hypothetical protein